MPDIQDTPLKMLKRNLNPVRLAGLTKRGLASLKNEGWEATWRAVDFRLRLATKRDVWQFRCDIPLKRELREQRLAVFEKMPVVSIVVPLFNTPVKYLKEMIDSVRSQSYPYWQLVCVDASTPGHEEVGRTVAGYRDERITYKKLDENKGISGNTNEGFKLCIGEYIALLDHDDVIQPNALYENVKAINEHKAELLYSDEVVLNEDLSKLVQYHFKIGYAPDYLRGMNYMTHFLVFSRRIAEKAGFFEDSVYDGSQDYDFILRLSEQARVIYHIPKVLYFWRSHSGSTAQDMSNKSYAFEAGRKAVQAHVDRIGLKGTAEILPFNGAYRVRYEVLGDPLVSVIIPNKDHIDDLEKCLVSIKEHGGWDNTEILVVENNSEDKATFEYYDSLPERFSNVKVLYYEGGFNFSAINNFAAKQASGDHLLLLNNDVELLTDGFIKEMLSFSQREDVGAVGAKLYYPDDTIQHGGVIMGINGSAGHSHRGIDRYVTKPDGERIENTGDLYRLVTVQNYLAVTAACLMVKKELYLRQPLDEESFAVAYNDVDFCLRLYEKGYLNVFTPFSRAYHYESKSRGLDESDKPNPRYEGEKKRFRDRWEKYFDYGDPYYNPHFTLLYDNYGYK